VFGGWPAEPVARLRDLQDATWIRGNVDRWAATEAPDGEPAHSGVERCPRAIGAQKRAVPGTASSSEESAALGTPAAPRAPESVERRSSHVQTG
jgi:hypothetical protein